MSTKTRRASKRNAAVQPKKSAIEETRITTEVQAAIGLNGVTVEGGRANVAVSLDIPQPTMAENKTWPWTAWNVQYLRKQVEKDLKRLATTIANLEHVSRTVEARAAAKAASKPAPAAIVAAAQPDGGQPTVAQ
jgi:hypothetical protein